MPMFVQNKTLRTHCLGNFATMTKAMINDGALQFWLDGQDNTLKAPNENLGRELMELFTLGVGSCFLIDFFGLSAGSASDSSSSVGFFAGAGMKMPSNGPE